MNIFYAHEKFNEAVRLLETGRSDVRSRLARAFIVLRPIREEDLPEDLRGDFRWLRAELTKREARNDEGPLRAELEQMEDQTGERIAEKIIELDSRLSSHLDQYDI